MIYINLDYAKQQFEAYLDHYDRKDDKVRLKIIHTYGVVHCSRKIASGWDLHRRILIWRSSLACSMISDGLNS